jgi:hypothetical protein
MADQNVVRRSSSFSSSEASDAGSTSSSWEKDDTDTNSPPVLRPAPPAPPVPLMPPSPASTAHTAQTIPIFTPASQPSSLSNAAIAGSSQRASAPTFELNGGVLTIKEIPYHNADVRDFLLANPSIHTVLVPVNGGSADGRNDILKQLGAMSSLKTIKFYCPDIYSHEYDVIDLNHDSWSAIEDLLGRSQGLGKLDFSGLRFTSSFLGVLANALKRNANCSVLDFSGRDLFISSPLERMDLAGFDAGIAGIISRCGRVSTILASRRGINDEGAMNIAAALEENTGLTMLSLAGNPIGTKGCAAIFDAVRKNGRTALLRLDLSGRTLDGGAASSLARLLEKNETLAEIAIGPVPDSKNLKAVWNGLLKNRTVVKLSVASSPRDDAQCVKIRSRIETELLKRALAAAGQAPNTSNAASSTSTANRADDATGKKH